jgi:fumarate hydratase, class I
MKTIAAKDVIKSIADALQFISYYHPADFVQALKSAHAKESSVPARNALLQLLVNSKMSALAHRPVCQDTGVAHVFFKIGMDVRIEGDAGQATPSLQQLANQATGIAYTLAANPLRASMITEPLGRRLNTHDNSPAIVHIEMVQGDTLELIVVAKGGGGDVKVRFGMLTASDSVADWVVDQLPGMGAGWCPPGVLGIGVGGSPEQAMVMAKRALFEPIDIQDLQHKLTLDPVERLRLDVYERANALKIGAQGLGGDHTVLDVKVATAPCHAALQPVALVPNCAATRFIRFELTGNGPAVFDAPAPETWADIPDYLPMTDGIAVDLDTVSPEQASQWRAGDLLLVSGKLLTGRDAAHKRLADLLDRGEPLPVDLRGRALFYVGPVDPIEGEAVGPAGPTTSARMDKFMPALLEKTGLLITIGKAERGPVAIEAIRRAKAPYLIAVGGAAYLVAKAVESARVVAFEDLGMEAIYEFTVRNMPVTVAIDARGRAIHRLRAIA